MGPRGRGVTHFFRAGSFTLFSMNSIPLYSFINIYASPSYREDPLRTKIFVS